MTRSIRMVCALFQKDAKDTLQNMNVMILVALPLLFSVLYSNIFKDMAADMPPHFLLNMVTGMTLALVPTSFLSMLVAEEKEKNTLRVLMLSGVKAPEFITSKVLLTLLLVEALSTACFFVTGGEGRMLPTYLFLVTLASIGLLLIGATIGLLCKDQMSTGVLATPISLVLLLPPMLGNINGVLAAIAKFTPIEWVLQLFLLVQDGGRLLSVEGARGMLTLLGWIVLSALLFGAVYRWRRLD